MESALSNNLWVIYKCSTNYLVISITITILSIFLVYLWNDTRLFAKHKRKSSMGVVQRCTSRGEESSQADGFQLRSAGEEDEEERSAEPSLMSRIKTAKHHFIVEQMTANMTEEQLKEEKEVEKAQLEAIFKLLQDQQDKFQVASVDQLQDQLNLYR